MGERKVISFRIAEDTRDKWEKYVEDRDDLDNKADLIRTAVAHEMSDEYGLLARAEGGGSSDERVGELLSAMNKMQTRMEDMEQRVADATEAMHSAGASASDDLTAAIWNALPEGRENATTAVDLANTLSVDSSKVRVGLEQLRANTNVVRQIKYEEIEESADETLTVDGREIQIEDGSDGVERQEPLWYKEV